MLSLFPPYGMRCHHSQRNVHGFETFPIPWAVPVEDIGSARVLIDCLKSAGVSSVEVVVDRDGQAYVRWTD